MKKPRKLKGSMYVCTLDVRAEVLRYGNQLIVISPDEPAFVVHNGSKHKIDLNPKGKK